MAFHLTSAVWSAAAASFSALSALVMMLIQRRNYLEAARPELVLTGWSRRTEGEGETARDSISFSTIRNVGKGAAHRLIANAYSQDSSDPPTLMMSTFRLPILAAGDSERVDSDIVLWFKNASRDYIAMRIVIYCWDARSRRHETVYTLMAAPLAPNVAVAFPVAPGLMLMERRSASRPIWLLKLIQSARRPVSIPKRLLPWRRRRRPLDSPPSRPSAG